MDKNIRWPLFGLLSKVDVIGIIIGLGIAIVNTPAAIVFLSCVWVYFIYEQRAALAAFMASFAMGRKNYERALSWYKTSAKVTNARPLNVQRYVLLGAKYGDINEVEETFNRIVKRRRFKDPLDVREIEVLRAFIQWQKGEIEVAIDTIEKAVNGVPNEAELGTLCFLKVIQGSNGENLEFLKDAFDKYPHNIILKSLYAISLYLHGDKSEAEDLFDRLTEGLANIPDTFYYYAKLLVEKGENEKALEIINKGEVLMVRTILSTISAATYKELMLELRGEDDPKEAENNSLDELDDFDD